VKDDDVVRSTPAAVGDEAPLAPTLSGTWLVLGLGIITACVFLITRLALLAQQRAWARGGFLTIGAVLVAGELHDLLVASWVMLPLALYLAVVPNRWYRHRLQRAVLWVGLGVVIYGLFFLAAAEWFFFEELGSRFNFVAVDYLLYPTEVVTNIWESYHTGWILAALLVPTGLALAALRSAVAGQSRESRWRRAWLCLGLFAMVSIGTFTASPRWGEVSGDRVLDEIARNGLYTFFGALRGSNASFDGLYATLPDAEILGRLHDLLREPKDASSFAASSTLRRIENAGPERPLNVVVVLEESLGAEFVGVLRRGPERTLTPGFDALSQQGTLLTHAYSTGNRTIRAIEATTAGTPPLPGVSLVRRPQSHDLFTLPALLRDRGYQTLFVYGGRALFDGMGGYLHRNGVERVVEQTDFPAGTFATAWGVADEFIFARALDEMDAMAALGRPFYTLVLSVSNHRPFRFPEDHLRGDHGLSGRENAVRYADWALGRFMSEARGRSWYGDTLFVLMGDPGARVYGAAQIPLASYEVPILFIGPGVPRGARVATLASSLDVPPTVLGMQGLDYDSRSYGRDELRVPPDGGRALMTHNSDAALLEGHRLAVLGLRGTKRVYDCDLERVTCRELDETEPAQRRVVEDAIAYYGGADLLYRSGALELPPASLAVHSGGGHGDGHRLGGAG
jgi:phosphoglycerol transferase MdoB-like AlkP superfamily enzyme